MVPSKGLFKDLPYIDWLPWITISGAAFFLMLSKEGITYLNENQAAYFIYGLRLSNPHFIPKDWFTWKVFHHDFAFGYLIKFLHFLGPLAVTTVLADFVLMVGMTYGLFILCRHFCKHAFLVFICLVTWLGIVGLHETELGKEYLFDGFLQPAELSGCLMVLGFALLFEKRFLLSGISLGIAGLFHGAILVSIVPALLATIVTMRIWENRRALLSFILPLGLCWGLFFLVLKMTLIRSTVPFQETLSILLNLRDHFVIASHWSVFWTLNWFLWISLGCVAMFNLPWDQKYNEWRACFFAVILTSVIGMAQSIFINIPSVTLIMLWRSSPMAIILSLVIIISQYVNWLLSPQGIKRRDIVLMSFMVLISVFFIHSKWGISNPRRFLWLMSFPLAAFAGWFFYFFSQNASLRNKVINAVVLFIMAIDIARGTYQGLKMSRNYETNPDPPSIGKMEQWVKGHTPKNSIFIVPPSMAYMRVRAGRAIVVDWKPPCFLPSDLQEWYLRLCNEAGLPAKPMIKDENVLIKGYDQLDLQRAERLKKLYGADYVVVLNKEHTGNLSGLIERFSNADYRVLEIP